MHVIIMRGISGCGKSTWVKKYAPDAIVASADDFFLQPDGEYLFSGALLHKAHEACFRTYLAAIERSEPLVVVDNSNITAWELSSYILPAESFGYTVEILTLRCDPEVAIARKRWIPEAAVHRKAKLMVEEEKRFPDFMKRMHRVIENN